MNNRYVTKKQYNPLNTLYFCPTASFSFLSEIKYAATLTNIYCWIAFIPPIIRLKCYLNLCKRNSFFITGTKIEFLFSKC